MIEDNNTANVSCVLSKISPKYLGKKNNKIGDSREIKGLFGKIYFSANRYTNKKVSICNSDLIRCKFVKLHPPITLAKAHSKVIAITP